MARSLAERMRLHEQQKARLAEQEAKIKLAERKARPRRRWSGPACSPGRTVSPAPWCGSGTCSAAGRTAGP